MKFTKLLLASILASACAVPAFADDDAAAEPITIAVNKNTGSLAGSGNYHSTFTTSQTDPVGLSITSKNGGTKLANNFDSWKSDYDWLGNNTGDTGATSTVFIDPTNDSWYVSSYKFDIYTTGSATNLVLNANGQGNVSVSATQQHVEVQLQEGTAASIVCSGTNGNSFIFANFEVTLSPVTIIPEVPIVPIQHSALNASGTDFDTFTTWYNIHFTGSKNCLATNGTANHILLDVAATTAQKGEDFQWCFVLQPDSTYKIYNRAEGVDKVLGVPSNAANGAFPIMVSDGTAGYDCTWNVTLAKKTSSGGDIDAALVAANGFFLAPANKPTAWINNFQGNGKVAVWNNGYDNGSVATLEMVEATLQLAPELGTMYRNGEISTNNMWCNSWVSNQGLANTFGTGKNNMTTTACTSNSNLHFDQGDFQLATGGSECTYTFGFSNAEHCLTAISFKASLTNTNNGSITLSIGSEQFEINSTDPVEISLKDIPEGSVYGLTISGSNNTRVNISDLQVSATLYVRAYEPHVVVFNSTHTYGRIPAICIVGEGAHKGRIIAAYDDRTTGHNDLGVGRSLISIEVSHSDDNGNTWTEQAYAKNAAGENVTEHAEYPAGLATGNGAPDAPKYWNVAWGDAALVGDRESQTVMMVAVGGTTGFFGSRRNNTQSAIRWMSYDGGDTWTEPENITEKIYTLFDGEPTYGFIDGMFFGSGRCFQSRYVKVGRYYRVYSAISSQNGGGNLRNWVVYTDDMGETWHILGGQNGPAVTSSADEPKVEELPDGSVLLAARRNGGDRNFNIFHYTNTQNGEGKWLTHFATNMGFGALNACNGEHMVLPVRNIQTGAEHYLSLQSFPCSSAREKVSIAYKPLVNPEDYDEPSDFANWQGRYQVCPASSTYSTFCLTAENKIGFIVEGAYVTGGNGLDGVYFNLPIELITDSLYEYCPDPDNAIAARMRKEMIQHRAAQLELSGSKFVGTPILDTEAIQGAVDAATANPSHENYVYFNSVVYAVGDSCVELQHEGIYRPLFAGNSQYSLTEDHFLTVNASGQLAVGTDPDDANARFQFFHASPNTWKIKNVGTGEWLKVSPANTQTQGGDKAFTFSADPNDAGEYIIDSNKDGYSYITCATPANATYGSIHMAGGDHPIVIWTNSAVASRWSLELMDNANEPGTDPGVETSINEISAASQVIYFDLQGRRVATPVPGKIYITNSRKKIKL